MNKIKVLGLAALVALNLGISSCSSEKQKEDTNSAPIDLSIQDLKKNITTYEGKFVRTSAKVLDFKEMSAISESAGTSRTFNSSYITLGDVNEGSREHITSSHEYGTIDKTNYKTLQQIQSDLNISMRNGEIIFVSGWMNSGVLDYTKITDSQGNVIFENKDMEKQLTFKGQVTDIQTTQISSSSYMKIINFESDEGEGKLRFLNISQYPDSYSEFKNAHVTVQSEGKVQPELYSLSEIKFDKNYIQSENPVDKKSFLKKVKQEDETIEAYVNTFNSLQLSETASPSMETALNMRDLSILVKYIGNDYVKASEKESDSKKKRADIKNSEKFYDLSKEVSKEATKTLITHKAYSVAIESCREVLGDDNASEVVGDIVSTLENNAEYYRAAKLAQTYCLNSKSSELYQKTVTELANRGLWSDAFEVADDAKIGNTKTLEIIADVRSDINKASEKIRVGSNITTSDTYLSQNNKDAALIKIIYSSDQNVHGKVIRFTENYGRVIIEGVKIKDSDTTNITGEFPILFLNTSSITFRPNN